MRMLPACAIMHANLVNRSLVLVRNNRTLNRIFFALVLAGGLFGAIVTASAWRVDVSGIDISGFDPTADWVDTVGVLGEELLQFFLGWTN